MANIPNSTYTQCLSHTQGLHNFYPINLILLILYYTVNHKEQCKSAGANSIHKIDTQWMLKRKYKKPKIEKKLDSWQKIWQSKGSRKTT